MNNVEEIDFINGQTYLQTPPPSNLDLAKFAAYAYGSLDPNPDISSLKPPQTPPDTVQMGGNDGEAVNTWTQLDLAQAFDSQAVAYVDADDDQVVVSFEGTANLSNLLTDLVSWGTGVPTPDLLRYLGEAAAFLVRVEQKVESTIYNGAPIYLTGHSLGGAIAEMLGRMSGLPAVGFNAPGTGELYDNPLTEQTLAPVKPANSGYSQIRGGGPSSMLARTGENLDIRVPGDMVSAIGWGGLTFPIGQIETITDDNQASIVNTNNTLPNALDLTDHSISTVIADLSDATAYPKLGVPSNDYGLVATALDGLWQAEVRDSGPVQVLKAVTYVVAGVRYIITPGKDPSITTLSAGTGSPGITAITLPDDGLNLAFFEVQTQIGGRWSTPLKVLPGAQISLASGAQAVRFRAIQASGQQAQLPEDYVFYASFASSGTLSATLQLSSPSAPTDFNADGNSDILLRNTAGGQAVIWTMNGLNRLSSVAPGNTLAGGWKAVGTGDFNGDGKADILWQNTGTGQAAAWLLDGTTVLSTTALGSRIGAAWNLIGAADFDGDGASDLLWQNSTTGQVAIWLMDGITPLSKTVIGSEPVAGWRLVGTGDFNGDGKADILWQNTATGQAAIWLMDGTHRMSSSAVGTAPAAGWKIVGTGDFDADGNSDLLWQNAASGQTAIWFMDGATKLSSATLGTPSGSGWRAIGTGDYNGDGHSDILWQNSNGNVSVWLMNGATEIGAATIKTASTWQAVAG